MNIKNCSSSIKNDTGMRKLNIGLETQKHLKQGDA